MKIVILDGYTENPGDLSWEGFEALGEVSIYDRTAFKGGDAEIIARAKGANAVIVNKTPLTAQTIAQLAPELKYIGVLATGYNTVDIEAAKAANIPVCNIPTYGTQAVAQFALALLLELCHQIGAHSSGVHTGKWSECPDFCYWESPLIELAGKTLGVIGFGRIGKATAKIATAFGMNILAYDSLVQANHLAKSVPLEYLLAQSDVISLHCPLLDSTRHIINENSISKMKDGAMIINTSRGPLIDELALANALKSGKIAGAGIDVVSVEPIALDNPLLGAPNCIITPHIAWAPRESRARLMAIAVDNLKAFTQDATQNRVN